jgi:hypothetical protein
MSNNLPKTTCPYCGGGARTRAASEVYGGRSNSAQWGNLLVCNNFPICDSYVGIHDGTNSPKGTLANRALRDLRKQAHTLFDAYAVNGHIVTRKEAYGIAGQWMGVVPFHVGDLRNEGCLSFVQRFPELREIFALQECEAQFVTRLREQLDADGVLVAARYVFLDSQPGRMLAPTVPGDTYPSQKWALRVLLGKYLAFAEPKYDRHGRHKWLCKTTPLGRAVLATPDAGESTVNHAVLTAAAL